ncbi:Aste57867_4039 [Aphanomyces stellatus]|uniref:Aste57867_4039 protein n=1 Tax=Aphanomyces stellatus TaxID=120398 RepID=A0A485KG62_9STRA|nr:hypothetical protein As57867_004028 [Aphanomyces stellatus]VFT81174.1 Aste57867_4039 [Aphanomyces stellatus]
MADQVSVENLLASPLQRQPSRTLIQVPLSLSRMDIKVLGPTAHARIRVGLDGREIDEAMLWRPTQVQKYVRGRIGNVPFAPGGDSLIHSIAITEGTAVPGTSSSGWTSMSCSTPRTVFRTVSHGMTLARVPADDSAVDVARRATLGVNPSSLRTSYDVVTNEEAVKAHTWTIIHEKSMQGMEHNTLSVGNLLGDDDDDDLGLADEESPVDVVEV